MAMLRLAIGLLVMFGILYWQLAGRRVAPKPPVVAGAGSGEAPTTAPGKTAQDVANKIEAAETPHTEDIENKLQKQITAE